MRYTSQLIPTKVENTTPINLNQKKANVFMSKNIYLYFFDKRSSN